MTTAQWRNNIVGHADVPPAELTANPLNWRQHPDRQQKALAEQLARVGWVQDVVVNQRTGNIVDGHLRVSLAVERGEPTVPVVYVDLSEEDERLVLATLDPLASMATTNEELLAQLTQGLELGGDLADALADFLPAGAPKEGKTHPDDAEPVPVETSVRPGDCYILGRHRLLCGDSTDPLQVPNLMAGNQAALMWTDPPYGVNYTGKTEEALQIENDIEYGLAELLTAAFTEVGRHLEPGAPFYIAHPAGPQSLTFWQVVTDIGWRIHEGLVWVKDSMVLGHADYHYRHEPILYGWTPGPGRSGRGKHDGTRWRGDNSQTSVFEVPRPKASREHPTMKPVELIEACLQNSSRAGEGVLDPFAGSGSTLIACERLERRCYAMEVDPRYVEVIVRRWENFTGLQAVKE